ncbi:MAG: chemotaxis protein CheR [Ponticaulis sp.]|nr:chemotaxis protein CheR [Ponticaulis sp.]
MNDTDFEFVTSELKRRSGIVIGKDKMYLLESRLSPIARKEGLESIDELIGMARRRRDEPTMKAIVDAMTTNETFFFRDKTPFDHLQNTVLPQLKEARPGQRIRILCAACSTGQEPYSIAMMLDQNPQLTGGAPVEIVAVDISDRVLEKARTGVYSQFEVQRGLPIKMLMNYFSQQGEVWKISDTIRSKVAFRNVNLLEPLSTLGKFDIVFCRNVLIYFDLPTKRDILTRLATQMNDKSFLLLGAAETVVGIVDSFAPNKAARGLYEKADRAPGMPRAGIRAA